MGSILLLQSSGAASVVAVAGMFAGMRVGTVADMFAGMRVGTVADMFAGMWVGTVADMFAVVVTTAGMPAVEDAVDWTNDSREGLL